LFFGEIVYSVKAYFSFKVVPVTLLEESFLLLDKGSICSKMQKSANKTGIRQKPTANSVFKKPVALLFCETSPLK
jgi:hypothetical protein